MRERRPLPFDEPKLPIDRVYVELTNICNFDCEFCPNGIMERKKGYMDFALFKKVVDEIAEEGIAREIVYHQQGEPTLYPRLAEAIQYGVSKGQKVVVTTNGSRLDDRVCDAMTGSRLDRLHVSLQTPDAESFRIRGAPYMSYEEFAERIAGGVRRVLAADAPTVVHVHFLTSPHPMLANPDNPDMKILSTDAELSQALVKWARTFLEGTADAARLPAIERDLARVSATRWNQLRLTPRLVLETKQVGEWVNPKIHTDEVIPARVGYCHGLTEMFAVLWNGDIAFCCIDWDGDTVTANARDTSLLAYLASRPVQRAIAGFKRFRPVHPHCAKCLGGNSWPVALVHQVGTIFYHKVYRRLLKDERPVG